MKGTSLLCLLLSWSALADQALLDRALKGPLADVKEIVFTTREFGKDGHWYANFAYYCPDPERKAYAAGGKLCALEIRSGAVRALVEDAKGSIRDPQVHYDGKKIIFSWRKADTEYFNLWEIDVDGKNLRRITDAPFDDIEPTYLPDGDIVFVSTRCKRWVNCWLTQVAVLYRCDKNGKNARILSSNIEHDNTPALMNDGRIMYTRWEYVDRSQLGYHHLWSSNPDGTAVQTLFGNMHHGNVIIDAKAIPGSDKILAIFSPGHGRTEHAGPIHVVDPRAGPDEKGFARQIGKGGDYRDPFALGADHFIAAEKSRIVLLDASGNTHELHKHAGPPVHEPRPITARKREPVIPDRVDPSKDTGRMILADVHVGRSMKSVKPGEIKKLLVVETLPKPVNFTGGMEPLSHGGTFTLERVLGTVPVEADGSAYFEVPALRPVFVVALDESGLSVKRMQSFMSVQPGEVMSCTGCHEQRNQAAPPRAQLEAVTRPASRIEPIADAPDLLDFPRDIQPILDKHCVRCHDCDKPENKIILTGDRGPLYSHAYYNITAHKLVIDGRNDVGNLAPRAIGSSASRLYRLLESGHYDVRAGTNELLKVRLWIDTGAAYPGTYAALGSGMIGGYVENIRDNTGSDHPAVIAGKKAIEAKCFGCHNEKLGRVPTTPWDDPKLHPWQGITDRIARHAVFNLTRPEKSTILLAPLSKAAGGWGTCAANAGGDVIASIDDPAYQAILRMTRQAAAQLDRVKRFDMPGFVPNESYIREMKRFGVLPAKHGVIDVYQTDREYWKSLWWPSMRKEMAE